MPKTTGYAGFRLQLETFFVDSFASDVDSDVRRSI
jgi:hypothetical protein